MKSKKEFINGVGEIEIKRWRSSKSIKLSYKPGHGFLLTYPFTSNKKTALEIIKLHQNWIEKIKEKYGNFKPKEIEETERKEIKKIFGLRIRELSQKYKLPFNNFYLKNMKTRWGSCSQKNNINLSIYLYNLPKELIDYVMIHELCHTIEKNHSNSFWNLMEKILPGAKKLDKKLGNHFKR